ncbi:MAG: ribonuclease Z [Chitinophagales bacterium]|nr:ribonuclease Z [Bacteroidota bacterium]MCB9044488.1 ribonuclease Z [Chitinophagales bacterium]
MNFSISILGSNSAVPAFGRHPSAQIVNFDEELFLLDCGEGTQMQFDTYNIRRSKINHIFISHLHGDHFFGLFGLLTSYALSRRDKPLHLYAHKDLMLYIDTVIQPQANNFIFPIIFHEIDAEIIPQLLFEDHKLKVWAFPLMHRIVCSGFIFEEKRRLPNMRRDKIADLNIPFQEIMGIKQGNHWTDENGTIHPHRHLTIAPPFPRRYVYMTDTSVQMQYRALVEGADFLYHETTFLQDSAERAKFTLHSTTTQAAEFAQAAKVQNLLIGHFSAKYFDLLPFLEEARAIFPNTFLGLEGKTFTIPLVHPPANNN